MVSMKKFIDEFLSKVSKTLTNKSISKEKTPLGARAVNGHLYAEYDAVRK